MLLCYYCLTDVLLLTMFFGFFLTVPWVGLQCVIVVFPYPTHLLFYRLETKRYITSLEV